MSVVVAFLAGLFLGMGIVCLALVIGWRLAEVRLRENELRSVLDQSGKRPW